MKTNATFRRGFTVVEVATTLVVIAILTTVVVVSYRAVQQDADTAAIEGDLLQATARLETHRANNGAYPATQQEVDDGAGLPKSSNERSYQYRRVSSTQYCLSMSSSTFTTTLRAQLGSDGGVTIAQGAAC